MPEQVTHENLDCSLQETCTSYVSTLTRVIYIAPGSIQITVTNTKLLLSV